MPRSFHLVGQPRGSAVAVEFSLSHQAAAVCVININTGVRSSRFKTLLFSFLSS